MLLTHRKLLQCKAIAIENDLRGTLRNFGLKVGLVGTAMAYMHVGKVDVPTVDALLVAPSGEARAYRYQSAARPTG